MEVKDGKVLLLVDKTCCLWDDDMTFAEAPIEHDLYNTLVILFGEGLKIWIISEIWPISGNEADTSLSWSRYWSVSNRSDVFGQEEANEFYLRALRVKLDLVDSRRNLCVSK